MSTVNGPLNVVIVPYAAKSSCNAWPGSEMKSPINQTKALSHRIVAFFLDCLLVEIHALQNKNNIKLI